MSLVLYTIPEITLPVLQCEPTLTVYIDKTNISTLSIYNIKKLPALVKIVGGKVNCIEGREEIERARSLTLEEVAHSLAAEKEK